VGAGLVQSCSGSQRGSNLGALHAAQLFCRLRERQLTRFVMFSSSTSGGMRLTTARMPSGTTRASDRPEARAPLGPEPKRESPGQQDSPEQPPNWREPR
jgi:hypothetical protein